MKTKTISSRKGSSSTKPRIKAPKMKKKAAHVSRSERAIQSTRPVTYVEPVIDREREAALLESATNEPC
jgi:hypothetical protein